MTHASEIGPGAETRSVILTLSGFAWEALERESTRMAVPVDELISFAAMYYIADADSGRVARRIELRPYARNSP
jgi:hypothetical protein